MTDKTKESETTATETAAKHPEVKIAAAVAAVPMPATTTAEQDRYTASQRGFNTIWEWTQSLIAVSVVGATLLAAFVLPDKSEMLANAFFLVIGFYFGRTNHARAGGTVATSEMKQ